MSRRLGYQGSVWERLDALEAFIRLAEANGAETPEEARERRRKAWRGFQKQSGFQELLRFAARDGAEVKPNSVYWDVSNGCHLAREIQNVVRVPGYVGTIPLRVACRKHCERCLRRHRMFWAHRAKAELQLAQRTWFGTLTLRPEAVAAATRTAVRRAMQSGVNWNDLTPGEVFARVHKECVKRLQLWMKRVRKVSGARLRYILVVEAHESGVPHWHCLVHEVRGSAPVTERELRLSWTQHGGGFTEFKLVRADDARAAFYVCKYLSKSALCRVMASSRYGSWGPHAEAWEPSLAIARRAQRTAKA